MLQFFKIILLGVVAVFIFAETQAQNRNIYFLKNNGKEVNNKDSADFIRIIHGLDSTSSFFRIQEFYTNNSPKFIGQVSSFGIRLVYEGPTLQFYSNGKKSEQVSYLDGKPFGLAYHFHLNGRVKKVIEYPIETKTNNHKPGEIPKVLSYFDSTGVEMVKEGNGYATITDAGEIVREEGRYTQGLKDGIWKGVFEEAGRHYEEVYNEGKLVSRVQTLPDGRNIRHA